MMPSARTGWRCHPGCRDRRPPAAGVARKVAELLDARRLTIAQMTAYLADTYRVDRFAELCFSHADSILLGLRDGVLADVIATYPTEEQP
jgi:hypothetical protein